MHKYFKKIVFLLALNLLVLASFSFEGFQASMLTGQLGINAALANQITGMLNAGMDVWSIVGLIATFNAAGVGLLLIAKSMLKKLGTAVVAGW